MCQKNVCLVFQCEDSQKVCGKVRAIVQIPSKTGVKFALKIFDVLNFKKHALQLFKANRRLLCTMHSLQLQAIRWMNLSIDGVLSTHFVSGVHKSDHSGKGLSYNVLLCAKRATFKQVVILKSQVWFRLRTEKLP